MAYLGIQNGSFLGRLKAKFVGSTLPLLGEPARLEVIPTQLTAATSTVAGASVSTSSVAPEAGQPIFAFVSTVLTGTPNIPTCTGNGLTWVLVDTEILSTRRTTVFRALGANPSEGAITFDFGGQSQDSFLWSVIQVEGADTTGTAGSGALVQSASSSGATTSTITSTLNELEHPNNIHICAVRLSGNLAVGEDADFTNITSTGAGGGPGRLEVQWATGEAVCTSTFTATNAIAISIEVKAGLVGQLSGADVVASVSIDGPDSWYVPATTSDFEALGLPTPDYLWLCQEGSGSLSSAIGSLTLTKNATGHLYEQTVTGWSRKFLGTDGSTAGQSWRTSSAVLDMASGESMAMIVLASHTQASGSTRSLLATASTGAGILFAGTTGIIRSQHGTNIADGTEDHTGLDTVHQLCWYRRGDTNQSGAETDLESIAGTHEEIARTGTIKGIGTVTAHAVAEARYSWIAIYKGTNAERDWAAYLAVLRGA